MWSRMSLSQNRRGKEEWKLERVAADTIKCARTVDSVTEARATEEEMCTSLRMAVNNGGCEESC